MISFYYGSKLLKFKDITEARDREYATYLIVDASNIDMSVLILCILQDAKEDTQTG